MKFGLVVALLIPSTLAHSKWYPLNTEDEPMYNAPGLTKGQELPIQCTKRNIESTEHIFDKSGNIMYAPFPNCKETGKSMVLKYHTDEDFLCTINLPDELYHLFQYYVHEDAPFSCRIPVSQENGLYVPLTFHVRGHVAESHIDIDPTMNVLAITPEDYSGVVSVVGWSSSTNTTRIVIGDDLELQVSTRWIKSSINGKSKVGQLPYPDGFYKIPIGGLGTSFYIVLTFLLTSVLTVGVTYAYLNKQSAHRYQIKLGAEGGISKRD